MISTVSSAPTTPSNRPPARTSPTTRSVPGTSLACTAKPSRTESPDRRKIAIRQDVLGKNAAGRRFQYDFFGSRKNPLGGDALDHACARLVEAHRGHNVILSDPRLFLLSDDRPARNNGVDMGPVLERIAIEQDQIGVLSLFDRADSLRDAQNASRRDGDSGERAFDS